jgi:prophage DNA circulation protein
MAATASSVEKRVLALEINQGVSDQTKELENRIRDLESMVRTARYVVTFCAGLITLVGIGVTAYVSSLTSEYNIANSKIEETKALLLTAQTGAEKTQVEITAQQTAADKLTAQTQQLATETQDNIRQTRGLQNTFDQLVKDASSRVRGAASEAVANAASTVFAPIPAFQQKTNSDITNLNTRQSQLVNLINEEFGKLQNGDSQQMEPLVPAAGTIDCGGGGIYSEDRFNRGRYRSNPFFLWSASLS